PCIRTRAGDGVAGSVAGTLPTARTATAAVAGLAHPLSPDAVSAPGPSTATEATARNEAAATATKAAVRRGGLERLDDRRARRQAGNDLRLRSVRDADRDGHVRRGLAVGAEDGHDLLATDGLHGQA